MKTIAFEEHFITQEFIDAMRSTVGFSTSANTDVLLDMDKGRLKVMDEAGVDMQVLSFFQPGVQALDVPVGVATAKKINDKLADVVKKYPTRFAGLAAIAPQAPEEAAKELERAVRKLGLKGTSINSHVKGEYLDDRKFRPIFAAAEKLDVPIYIHPQRPSPELLKSFSAYPVLAGAMAGFAAEVSLHALRLICSGLFDEYPKLKIVLGHMGEALPYWLWRIDNHWKRDPLSKKLKKTPSQYIKDNFFITTSGMFWGPPLMCAYLALGADNILFAVDYPFESSQEGVQFIQSVPICDSDKEKICHLNAEKLLGL
ncbi:MAG: amidohydrolase family protein [Chloroflexota bacterium]